MARSTPLRRPSNKYYPPDPNPPMSSGQAPFAGGRPTVPGPPLPPRHNDMYEQTAEVPPPVPSTPRPKFNLSPSSLQYPGKDEVFTVSELITKHQHLFPLRVVVVRGHFGDRGEDSAIATDEVYNVHFVKKSKVFTIKDCQGNKYIIPLNSATKFGFTYSGGIQCYDTVEDVLKVTPLPQMITATVLYKGTNENTTVHREEVLIIKGITKGNKLRKSKTTLNVFSLRTNEMKHLPKEVFGRFTTDPCYNQMYLTDMIKHLRNPIPIKAHLYIDFESEEPLPDYLTTELVTIENEFIETSVVTSPMYEDEQGSNNFVALNEKIVDIPTTLPIEVSVLPPEEDDSQDYEELYEATRDLISAYNPMLGRTYRDNSSNDYSYASQTFSAVRKGYESEGLNIQLPETISSSKLPLAAGPGDEKRKSRYQPIIRPVEEFDYEDVNPQHMSSESSPQHSTQSSTFGFDGAPGSVSSSAHMLSRGVSLPGGPPVLPPRRSTGTPTRTTRGSLSSAPVTPRGGSLSTPTSADGVFHSPSDTRPPVGVSSIAIESLQQRLKSVVKRLESLETSDTNQGISDVKQELDLLVPLSKSLQKTCLSLESEVKLLKTDMTDLKKMVEHLSKSGQEASSEASSTNTSLLALDASQLLQLLELMGPSIAKHRDTFAREGIDGELLAQCTEEILENELGMSSHLDRLKLMQVVRGTKTVESIFQGSYVRFQFNGSQNTST